MNETHSRNVQIVIAEDNGRITVIEPLEDPNADLTPEMREKLLAYYAKMRQLLGRRASATRPENGTP